MSRVFGATRVAMMAVAAKGKGKAAGAAPAGGGAAALSEKPRSTGIFKVVPISPAMRRFLGVQESSRTDAVKRIWQYIKENNLQNPSNKREIRCDEKLKSIFEGKDTVNFLEVARLMGRHFVKTS
ncbi:Upstream activation factor subunit [Nymphaea thermarum]|nr:Upstream activation factor subunit [Nymphaea thermarum]